jgi:hypothetical protein
LLGGDLVLGGRGFQLFELQLHLIQKPRCPFRARPEKFALQLLDLKFEMRDQRLLDGEFGLCGGGVSLGQNPSVAFGDERRFQRFDVVGKIEEAGVHDPNKIIKSAICGAPIFRVIQYVAAYPAACGRHVCRGFLQSMPSSM